MNKSLVLLVLTFWGNTIFAQEGMNEPEDTSWKKEYRETAYPDQ